MTQHCGALWQITTQRSHICHGYRISSNKTSSFHQNCVSSSASIRLEPHFTISDKSNADTSLTPSLPSHQPPTQARAQREPDPDPRAARANMRGQDPAFKPKTCYARFRHVYLYYIHRTVDYQSRSPACDLSERSTGRVRVQCGPAQACAQCSPISASRTRAQHGPGLSSIIFPSNVNKIDILYAFSSDSESPFGYKMQYTCVMG